VKNHIADLRSERGWTQADLAQRVGVSRQSINAIETGKFDPSLPLAFRIAKLFDMSTEDVFLDDRRPPSQTRTPRSPQRTERTVNDPAKRLGAIQMIASTDAAYPDLGDVPVDLAHELDALQPNWRRIIELLRDDAAVGAGDSQRDDLEKRLAAVESHLADVAYSVGVPRRKAPKPRT